MALVFEAPGPGVWGLDRSHWPRPWSKLQDEIFGRAVDRASGVSNRRYGQLGLTGGRALVHRFPYSQGRYLVPGDGAATSREDFERFLASDPEARLRMANAGEALATSAWRGDVAQWDASVKPAIAAETARLTAVDPRALGTEALAAHLRETLAHLEHTTYLHHFYSLTYVIPIGLFLLRAGELTGLTHAALGELLRGASPVSAGAKDELTALAAAIRADPASEALLGAEADPGRLLSSLGAAPGPPGEAAKRYVNAAGYVTIEGFDVVDRYALENPGILVAAIRLAGVAPRARHEDVEEEIAAVRAAVPAPYRAEFDMLLADARNCYRIKDERGMLCNFPVSALTRRGLLALGERLAAQGRAHDPEHVVEAGEQELPALVSGGGPPPDELAERFTFRVTHSSADAPAVIGAPPSPIRPPIEWLPESAARLTRAIGAGFALHAYAPSVAAGGRAIRGAPASRGRYTGVARVALRPDELARIAPGEILVTWATNPAISGLMATIGAIVTDHGGALSHAAIVARECGIPAVTGCQTATTAIPDGATITVDGSLGEVTILR